MKRFILTFFHLLTFVTLIHSNNFQLGINYQAVARNSEGEVLASQQLDVRFSILSESTTGTLEWEEIHEVTTNAFGVFSLKIGQGSRTNGSISSFENIDWSTVLYLKTEINFGSGYQEISNTQLAWVPYALYALNSGNSSSDSTSTVITYNEDTYKLYQDGNLIADLSGLKSSSSNQSLSIKGQVLSITSGNEITLPLQTLSISSNTLKLNSADGTVSSTVTVDADPTNEIQLLRINSDTLELYRTGVTQADSKMNLPDLYENSDTFYLKSYAKPTKISLRNELSIPQTNKLKINRGNTVTIDTDTTNEIQDLSLTSNVLKITKNSAATSINLSGYLDNTDNQTLTYNSSDSSLVISGSNSKVSLSNMVNTAWVAFSAYYSPGSINIPTSSELQIPWVKDFDTNNALNSYVFTAPSAGYYTFSVTFILTAGSDNLDFIVYKNGVKYKTFPSISSNTFTTNFLVNLNSLGTIEVRFANNSSSNTYYLKYATFSGYKVH
jgi:hypothetical protein